MKTPIFNLKTEHTPLARDLRKLEQDILRMGALVEKSCRFSHSALFEQDIQAVAELPKLDKKIDTFYKQVEAECTRIITHYAPAEQDLRCLSAFMQLVRDLERIGDYAKDLADIAVKLLPYPPQSTILDVAMMSRHTQAMLACSLEALGDLDETKGRNIKHLDDEVDNAYERVYQSLAQQRDVQGVLEPYILWGLTIRCLERMADHATNIGSRVTYIVTGQRG